MYRINFGNGQVHGTFETYADCMRALMSCNPDAYTFVQRYESGSADAPGDWVTVTEYEQKRRRRGHGS